MRFVSRTAVAAALLAPLALSLAVAPAAAQKKKKEEAAQGQPKFNPSKGFIPLYQEADKAIKSGDVAAANTAIAAAVAGATNEDDKYLASQLYVVLGQNTKDDATILKGLELAMASSVTPPDAKAQYGTILGKNAYVKKDYAAAIKYLTAAQAAGSTDKDIAPVLADAYTKSGNPAEGAKMTRAEIDRATAAGQVPAESLYRSALQQAINAKDTAAIGTYSQALLKNYPSAETWKIALKLFRDNTRLEEADNLDLMRLLRQTGGMESERDYGEYADSAGPARLPGEVAAVLQEGVNKKVYSASSPALGPALKLAQGAIAEDKASLPASERDAAKGSNPKVIMSAADGNFSYGNYAKAAEFYAKVASLGGPDADRANLRLGMARTLAGDKAGAATALDAVTAPNRKVIAGYWKLFGEKGAPAAAAAPTSAGATVSTPAS